MSLLSQTPAPVSAATLEEARQLFVQTPAGDPRREAYLAQWREFSAREVGSARNIFDARNAYFRAYGETPEKASALQKFLHLLEEDIIAATTRGLLQFLADFAPLLSEARSHALQKLSLTV